MVKREQKLLRIGAAAHELGLHPITVRRWIKAGRIQVVQMGREVRVPRTEIERMVGKLDGRLLVLGSAGIGNKTVWRPNWNGCKRGHKASAKGKKRWRSPILAVA